MKIRISHIAKKGLISCLLACSFAFSIHAQTTSLRLINGKASVKKSFLPRKESDAHFYFLKLRKGQRIAIDLDSNSVFLTKENECAVYFQLFDPKGNEVWLGDSMVGIDEWQGEIEAAGNYKLKIYMSGLEGFTTQELRRKKPVFKYSLIIQMKKKPSE